MSPEEREVQWSVDDWTVDDWYEYALSEYSEEDAGEVFDGYDF